jgi:hypothetical protein
VNIDMYTDAQMRQELISFFGWRPEDVYKLSARELAAWKKHAIALRHAGFWWFEEGEVTTPEKL